MQLIKSISEVFPVGNAAGWCKSLAEVEALAKSAAAFIVVGSITLNERAGNPGNTFNGHSLNSRGLPNPGLEKLKEIGPMMVDVAHNAGKPIILSVAGFEPSEYLELAFSGVRLGFDGIEFNLGCPNVADGGKRKPIASFDHKIIEEIVFTYGSATKRFREDIFLSVKVSPMSNPLEILDIAKLISETEVGAVVTQNTFPNGLLFEESGTPQIQTPDKTGWAGFAGREIKAMALGQVSQWRAALNHHDAEKIKVWGVGGVHSGKDVRDMRRAGAEIVQVGTAYFNGGAKVFADLATEFINL